jgi:hypothetical protein
MLVIDRWRASALDYRWLSPGKVRSYRWPSAVSGCLNRPRGLQSNLVWSRGRFNMNSSPHCRWWQFGPAIVSIHPCPEARSRRSTSPQPAPSW